jgi:hypothetical protein
MSPTRIPLLNRTNSEIKLALLKIPVIFRLTALHVDTMEIPASPLVRFFKFNPCAIPSAPRVEEAFNTERIISPENAHLFPAPIRVKIRTKGRGWTDFLNPFTSHAPVLCSQRVVDTVMAEQLKGIQLIPVTLEYEKKSTILSPPCNYYWMIPTGKVLPYSVKIYRRNDQTYTHWFDSGSLKEARLRAGGEIFDFRLIPMHSYWDGSDVIKVREDSFTAGGMYCSRRFVEIAYREKWSNLWVTPYDCLGVGIFKDLQDLSWPPELWYPSNQPID